MKATAERYLKKALGDDAAVFRDGQWESIERLVGRRRVLVVQRTGWGKSMVYFLATKLLREQGAGPTLLISPLLSLVRNQIEAAARIGVTARAIHSANFEEWPAVSRELDENKVDVLLISPERLANADFHQNTLAAMVGNIGMLVIDEAHCISDWGHDFRPDYRRIVRVLDAIPANTPVLATTATANDRVVADVQSQLGKDIIVQRGSLVRKTLKLQNISMPRAAARLAWLAQTIPTLRGSGIVYTLTQRDAERVTEWLGKNSITAKAYHAGIREREALEQHLLNNEIKVLVATVALGMGFDKPDLGFVIHYQRPSSVVHYYQQVGRAGRAVDEAYGVLLCGEEDDRIADYFIKTAFPPQQHIAEILDALDKADCGLSVPDMQRVLNLSKNQIEQTLRFLTVESPAPLTKIETKWQATAAAGAYRINQEYVNAITNTRRQEQQQMRDYMRHDGCLMAFLQAALDDPAPANCGQCKNCNPDLLLDESCGQNVAGKASAYLHTNHQLFEPRVQWPAKDMFVHSPLVGFKISDDLKAAPGRALCLANDGGGQLVSQGKHQNKQFDERLVKACVKMLQAWSPAPAPKWITCIPSLTHPELLPDFAARLADALGLRFVPCIEKTRQNQPQKEMANGFQRVKNLDGAFTVNLQRANTPPCLLVDDVVDSRWTLTVASALLRQAGCAAVHPMALALNPSGMEL